jgi:diguanylate cyclase (GGDEF)-like protein
MNQELVKSIRDCPSLPSLPAIALQLLEMAQTEQVDIAEIARIISKDPALASKILKTVNSSFYARSQTISTISHSLVILGLQSVKSLVLGFSLVSTLSQKKAKGFKHIVYWRRSIYSATAARLLAQKLQVVQQEECFLAALLQDIGMLVLDQVIPDQYGEIHEKVTNHQELLGVEQAALGMNHADVSRIIAEHWKLPPVLSVPMSLHHKPSEVTEAALRKLTEVVALAGRCADVFVDEHAAEAIAHVRKFCHENYKIAEPDCDALMDEICKRTKEVAPLFEISISSSVNYEAILAKANQALVDLTLKTQQQAVSLEHEAVKLKEAATTDGLTGLANRATLDQFMDKQFAAAVRDQTPLAVLMMDVDQFKSINDKNGHSAGDQVLRMLGRLLKSAARSRDLAARYGGEELVLVMPGTVKATAAAIAESIRRTIAAKPISCEAGSVSVTISIGVASLEPGLPFRDAAQLMRAADLAVYAAKQAGRNCVKVFSINKTAA